MFISFNFTNLLTSLRLIKQHSTLYQVPGVRF